MFNFHKKEDLQIQDHIMNELQWDQIINSTDVENNLKIST